MVDAVILLERGGARANAALGLWRVGGSRGDCGDEDNTCDNVAGGASYGALSGDWSGITTDPGQDLLKPEEDDDDDSASTAGSFRSGDSGTWTGAQFISQCRGNPH